ncbi:HlyD family secretion protein [Deminuibacter soli]|uniref:HlyD family efflux transporter periplasmic adaptor subunit n=1 Tax=Deminuibacter soli TaxID=2291815 RepID=A0A3E1NFV0_9BACT|nr:HlyD family efflux transporter periplasmic adaptor subunit [Deminuibacter soli]RFM26752.1 HlyD family efflux transporter periplasmic adaptor subunit [Deminuibacter soli]
MSITIDQNDEIQAVRDVVIDEGLYQRSDMAQEIISHQPSFLEKWALLVLLVVLVCLFGATGLISYPDTIEAKANLTSSNSAKEVVVHQDGRLTKLFVQSNQQVHSGEVIGWVECTGSHQQILELSKMLDSSIALLNKGDFERLAGLYHTNYIDLGELQDEYKAYTTALQLFNDYVLNGFYQRKKAVVDRDLVSMDANRAMVLQQRQLTEHDLQLAEESYRMKKVLFEQKVISKDEFRGEESKLDNKKLLIPQLDASLLALDAQARAKRKDLDQLEHDKNEELSVFRQSLLSLKSHVDTWKKNFILIAPIDGIIMFTAPLQENQYLRSGKQICFITPNNIDIYAELYLPQANFGKIDTGLSVQLRLDAYPFEENGVLQGRLNYISNLPSDSGFLATVQLSHGLVTNNKRNIVYREGLKAKAIIITKDMTLLQRIYYNVVKATAVHQ